MTPVENRSRLSQCVSDRPFISGKKKKVLSFSLFLTREARSVHGVCGMPHGAVHIIDI